MVSKYWKIVFAVLVSTLVVACSNSRTTQVEKRNIPIEFHNGDIAFRRGTGVASRAVLSANNRGSFSHVGVVANIEGEWCVVHAVPYEGKLSSDDRVYSEPTGEFFNTMKATSGAVYRLEGLDSLRQESIRQYLVRQLDIKTLFDHDYDLSDTTKLYCSELVWRAYLGVDIDISNGSRTKVILPGFAGIHIMPSDIEHNEELHLMYRF